MSKVAQFHQFQSAIQAVVYQHHIEQKAADSWWVFRSVLDLNGQRSPFSRVVFFARSEEEAAQWVAQQQAGSDKASLAMSA